ncbi:hypothetical protein IW492_11390 [Enterococcus sp. BWB1-3]|uniref:hypothetical protein n=1 Tax=unclassified Enterococcus TaxID=2608891 RepID=UPI0019233BB8|nr:MULTISPECIES: hypothetical protein [unclassified Enterococcus]MBL1229835.1 hypothetical protein [Enterococcus sp. BWB1-3]MCB5954244.1 hypothetical protein [Enterococcus sp. CWB-B31]
MEEFIFSLNKTNKIVLKIDSKNEVYREGMILHYFDQCEVYLILDRKEYLVFNDYLTEGIKSFCNTLKLVLANEYPIIEEHFELGEGYFTNEDIDSDFFLPVLSPIWMSIGKDIHALWLYNYKNKIYLELSPIYPHHSSEITPCSKTYDEFRMDYRLDYRTEIEHSLLECWLEQSQGILDSLQI